MNSLAVVDPAFLALPGLTELAAPLAQEILLLEAHVAGTSHLPGAAIDDEVAVGAVLTCRREPNNPHDRWAIRLEHSGVKIGYLPKAKNEVPARLLDAGKELRVRVTGKEWRESWLVIDISVSLWDA